MLESLVGLNPDIEKISLTDEIPIEWVYYDTFKRNIFKSNYSQELNHDKAENLKNTVLGFLQRRIHEVNISSGVLRNCFKLIDYLHPSMLELLDGDSIYQTSNGTVIFDWEKDQDNVFSLEIGSEYIGYFVEIDGIDIIQVDCEKLDINSSNVIKDLSNFLN